MDDTPNDVTRHGAPVRDTQRQEVASDKIEVYERRIKELEDKAMHLEIDKRAREQIINMLKEDRETLFVQVSNHVRTITDQARVIGQLETRLELGPGRVVEDRPVRDDRPPVQETERPAQEVRSYESESGSNDPLSALQPNKKTPCGETLLPWPRNGSRSPRTTSSRRSNIYGTYKAPGQGDNRPLGHSGTGVQ